MDWYELRINGVRADDGLRKSDIGDRSADIFFARKPQARENPFPKGRIIYWTSLCDTVVHMNIRVHLTRKHIGKPRYILAGPAQWTFRPEAK